MCSLRLLSESTRCLPCSLLDAVSFRVGPCFSDSSVEGLTPHKIVRSHNVVWLLAKALPFGFAFFTLCFSIQIFVSAVTRNRWAVRFGLRREPERISNLGVVRT